MTIGISAHGNSDTTHATLTALFSSVEGDFELILVDDFSPDQTLDLFCEAALYHPNTKVFSFHKNLEYSGSLNAILSHATGKYVIFISNDVLVTPDYISTLLAVARHSDEFGIVRGCSNFVDNGFSSHNIIPDRDLTGLEELFRFSRMILNNHGDELGFDKFLTGDAFLVSRKVLNAIGGLDPLFYGYFADHDFGVRVRRAGFQLVLACGAFALHRHMANFDYLPEEEKKAKRNRRWARVHENWARFKLKYGLPVDLPYEGVRRIDWDGQVASPVLAGTLYCPPEDYSPYLIIAGAGQGKSRLEEHNTAQRALKYMMQARLTDASALCLRGVELSPEHAEIMTVLGCVRFYQGLFEDAIGCFKTSMDLDSSYLKAHSCLLLAMNYSERYSQREIFAESRRWDALHGKSDRTSPVRPIRGESRIRVGFISGDMRNHSVSYFLEPLLATLDRDRFQIFCYPDVATPDNVTERLRKLADRWLDISGLPDNVVADTIRSDQVDILVDLAGHTGSRIRLPVFSDRPAPIQVSWLGYPNTTGLTSIGYRLTDGIADPPGPDDNLYSEKLVRLKDGFLCYRAPEDAPETVPSPSIENGYITFGSFNMLPKISPAVIAVWARILRRVKDSRLVLKCHYFADRTTTQRFTGYFADFGIAGDRLELRTSTPNQKDHLAGYHDVDIALDTFPYNGTTTTFEALWMGVPVVTLSGDRHASRVGADILTRLDLSSMIAFSADEYIALALGLANDMQKLSLLRAELRNRLARSPLCDARLFARGVEDAFCSMLNLEQVTSID
ncbi:MAG: glycosyltransferase [Oryzomonas sp.]|uniref:O-linked N-acetylglucosamine transferase family protein n=1 Tax=Oryzomonas sp. TaxID=2855186 RepID=UPI0028424F47|nr:glycosyltransferase [Oryzomonas sp.]MDR3581068.1 glycosyltransferase [Oryzomonas sp.]